MKMHAVLIVLGSPDNELAEEDLYTSTVLQVIAKAGRPVLCMPYIAIAEEPAPAASRHAVTV